MPPHVTFQPIGVLINGHDSDGRLILADDQLAAVVVRLDVEMHSAADRGPWYLEAGFGKCAASSSGLLWATPEAVGQWVVDRLAGKA